MAYMNDTRSNRRNALHECFQMFPDRLVGRSTENVNVRVSILIQRVRKELHWLTHLTQCNGTLEDCIPESVWMPTLMNSPKTKATLGVPEHLNWSFIDNTVWTEFLKEGDL